MADIDAEQNSRISHLYTFLKSFTLIVCSDSVRFLYVVSALDYSEWLFNDNQLWVEREELSGLCELTKQWKKHLLV